jgi:haloacid dehalogenase superfamily, subfamily IA, variant 3 with third motif having DD or ED/haloacid dehalogenase superfamily, subfamily IA, variant 1 with third motif having Dx(3-4)D or Dx(3-4)E
VAEQIEAVIYDMGGVILRSEDYRPRIQLAEQYGLTEQGLEDVVFDSESAWQATVGKISQEAHWQAVFDTLNVPVDQYQSFQDAFWAGDRLDHDLVEFLNSLRPARKTGLLSNAWRGTRQLLFEHYACQNVFDVSVFSYEVGLAKPDRAFYELILTRLGVEANQAIFLDDNRQNIEAAAQLGIHAVHFRNRNQALKDMQALL